MASAKNSDPVREGEARRNARRQGYEFDVRLDTWRLDKDTTVKLTWLDDRLTYELSLSYRLLLAQFAGDYSAAYTAVINDDFKCYVDWIINQKGSFQGFSQADIISYRATLREEQYGRLYTLSRLLRQWGSTYRGEIPEDVVDLLQKWKLKGSPKGVAVRIQCPYNGPLTELEFEAVWHSVVSALEQGQIRLPSFVLVMLFAATGRRPVQLRDLKVKDLTKGKASDGLAIYVLSIPRAKVGGSDDPWRSEFKDVGLEPDIGEALERYIEECRHRLERLIPGVSETVIQELPLFPAWKDFDGLATISSATLLETMKTDYFHRRINSIGHALTVAIERLEVHSERIAERMHVYPTRVRRTIGSRAAREGYGSLVIAELLDHSDTQNVRVYTENVAENVRAINAAVSREMAPLAQAFAGAVIDRESDAVRGSDPASRIRTDLGDVAGSCGKYGFCGALAPVACYTCRHFQPWLDGPHEWVLQQLERENERIRKLCGDETIAAINQRTMLAVAQVVLLCEQRRSELEEGTDV